MNYTRYKLEVKALLHKHETKEMARSHHKLEASPTASPHKPINPRLSRPSLILKEPEFNLEYL